MQPPGDPIYAVAIPEDLGVLGGGPAQGVGPHVSHKAQGLIWQARLRLAQETLVLLRALASDPTIGTRSV